jgi:hypothetical protein
VLTNIHLSLLIGDTYGPRPAPAEVMDALDSVQVTSSSHNSGFQLSFKIGNTSPLQTSLLPSGFFDPLSTRVIVAVIVSGTQQVLVDGVITRHEIAPSNEPGKSTLTITGEDLSALMNIDERPYVRFPGVPVNGRVEMILATYTLLGITPLVVPPVIFDVPNPIEKIPSQTGTDLEYIQSLARACGYVFFIEPGPSPGSSVAYFGPDLYVPSAQHALSVNMGPETNVESLSFSLDGKASRLAVLLVTDPVSRRAAVPVAIPEINLLRPPLGTRFPPLGRVSFPEGIAKLSASEAANKGLGIVFRAGANMITGSGSLDVLRYGDVLRSRMLVGVRGAGFAYDGNYYVNSVTHSLKRGDYKQNFQLSRDGLNSNTSTVQP